MRFIIVCKSLEHFMKVPCVRQRSNRGFAALLLVEAKDQSLPMNDSSPRPSPRTRRRGRRLGQVLWPRAALFQGLGFLRRLLQFLNRPWCRMGGKSGFAHRSVLRKAIGYRLCIMRMIGHLPNETSAATFSDFLYVEGITNLVAAAKDGWAIWIHSEDQLQRARELFLSYLG